MSVTAMKVAEYEYGGITMSKMIFVSITIDDEKTNEFMEAIEQLSIQFEANYELLDKQDYSEAELDNKAQTDIYLSDFFAKLGISASLDGYKYLKAIVGIVLSDPTYFKGNITSRLYPEVAIMFDTKSACVERSIRHAISTICDKGNYAYMLDVFGGTVSESTGKPTNSAFIARTLELVKENVHDLGLHRDLLD